ncbi:MAG: hypothetical protein AAF680_12645 [Pseudomonadota bacterium]
MRVFLMQVTKLGSLSACLFLFATSASIASEPYGRDVVLDRSVNTYRQLAYYGSPATPWVLSGAGHEAAVVGDITPRVEADSEESDPDQRRRIRSVLIPRLEAEVAEQERSLGPYAAVMSETLEELARAHERLGNDPAGVEARERALFLIRVNEGLSSATQGPLVRALLNSLRRQQDFEGLDDRYRYFFRLYGSGLPPWSEDRWTATLEYLAWQREALERDIDGERASRLLRLHTLHRDLNRALEESWEAEEDRATSGLTWRHRVDAALNYLDTLYLVQALITPIADQLQYNQKRTTRYDPLAPDDQPQQTQQLVALQRSAQRRGTAALEASLATIPTTERKARAVVLLNLADWLQWNGSLRRASDVYVELWKFLKAGGPAEQELLDRWLSEPRPLPDRPVFWVVDREIRLRAEVSVDVTSRGRGKARLKSVAGGRPIGSTRLLRALNEVRYRPAFQEASESGEEPEDAVVEPVAYRLETESAILFK